MVSERLRSVALILLTVAIIVALFWFVDVGGVVEALAAADWRYLVASLVPILFMLGVKAHRWSATVEVFGHSVSIPRSLLVDLATYPAVGVTPSRSGELLKLYYFEELPNRVTLGTIVVVRSFDLLLVGAFGVLGAVWHLGAAGPTGESNTAIALAGSALAAGLVAVVYRRSLWTLLERKYPRAVESLSTALGQRRSLGLVAIDSTLLFALSVVQALLLFAAVGVRLPPLVGLTAVPAAIFVGLLPVTVGGMGTRDTAFVVLLAEYGTPEQALAGGLLFSAFRYWLLAVVGLPFMHLEGTD